MGANFTPVFNPYSGQGAFRYWCQTVLPLVYDDSLSYYELLNKMVVYLNNTIEDVKTVEDNLDATKDSFISLQEYTNTHIDAVEELVSEMQAFMNDYFENLDVQEEINEKLDAMALDGSLSRILAPILAVDVPPAVTTWLNENVTPVGSAVVVDSSLSITGAAADAKVTGDEISSLNGDLDFDYYLINNGTYTIQTSDLESGSWAYSNKSTSDKRLRNKKLIPIRAGMVIYYTNPTLRVYFGVLETQTSLEYIQTSGWIDSGSSGIYPITKDGWLTFIARSDDDITIDDYDCTVSFKTVLRKQTLDYYAPTESFGVADMPRNSYSMVVPPSTFSDCPIDLLNNYAVFVEKRSANDAGNIAIVTVTNEEDVSDAYSTLFVEPSTLRPWVKVQVNEDLTSGRRITTSKSEYGVDYTWDASKGMYHVVGTRTGGMSYYNIVRAIPTSVGKKYYVQYDHETNNLTLQFYGYDSSNNSVTIKTGVTSKYTTITIPEGVVSFWYRFTPYSDVAINEYANVKVTEEDTVAFLYNSSLTANADPLPSCDLNTLTSVNGYWLLVDRYEYSHTPNNVTSGYLFVYQCANWTLQVFYGLATTKMWARRLNSVGNWNDWNELSGLKNEYNNEYVTNHYENSYTITCSPTITTDTNNYLASTGDSTDRTGDIQTMLNTTGICHLGPGDFYVTGVEVPNYGTLIGSGNATRIVLASSVTNGYAVKLKTNGKVKDLLIDGNPAGTQITRPASVGTRHGVLFEGTANAESNPTTYYRSAVTNCMVRNFTGGGITLYNTGLSPASNLLISDCFIFWCGAGINISYYSEFSRITNVTAQSCLYGCIDNGGNNNFANCDFSSNTVGLLIDNSTGQSPNNSHGSFVGCTFNHSDNNEGTAIRILGAIAGEVFTGAQIFYGAIEIDSSTSIRFIGANIGRQVPITVTDSTVVVFSDCSMYSASENPLTQSGNTSLAFKDCYVRSGAVYNPMS